MRDSLTQFNKQWICRWQKMSKAIEEKDLHESSIYFEIYRQK